MSLDLQQHLMQIIRTKAFVSLSCLDNLSTLLAFDGTVRFLILGVYGPRRAHITAILILAEFTLAFGKGQTRIGTEEENTCEAV